jgi:LTXXQ motif family protein
MRGHGLVVVGVVSVILVLPRAAEAQFSPQGIIGAATAPLRDMLGSFRHRIPHFQRHRVVPDARSAANSRGPAATAAPAADLWLSRLGPPAWASAYEDLLGYVFWPDDYAQQFKGRGFDVIADTIVGPFAVQTRAASTTGSTTQDSAANCDMPSGEQDKWPQTRVEQTLQLSDAQKEALEKFQSAVVQSVNSAKIGCRNPNEVTPPNRLGTLIQALWAVHDTGLLVRGPLRTFTESLSAEQSAALAPKLDGTPQPASGTANGASKETQACAAQNIGAAERMIKQIEQRVRANKGQSASLENLHKVSTNMAKLLTGGCAQPIPGDPLARLDAADEQLTTMNYAATTVQIAFDDFYGRLDDRQKARLNSAGR